MRTPSASFSCECMNAGYTRHTYLPTLRDTDVKNFRQSCSRSLKHAQRMSFQRDRRAIWETSLESPLFERQLRELSDASESQSCGFGETCNFQTAAFSES